MGRDAAYVSAPSRDVDVLGDRQHVQCRIESLRQLAAVRQGRLRRLAEIRGNQDVLERNHGDLLELTWRDAEVERDGQHERRLDAVEHQRRILPLLERFDRRAIEEDGCRTAAP